jgi:hypothetical protein
MIRATSCLVGALGGLLLVISAPACAVISADAEVERSMAGVTACEHRLSPSPTTALEVAVNAYNASSSPIDWREIDDVRVYSAACDRPLADDEVVALFEELEGAPWGAQWSVTLDRDALKQSWMFGSSSGHELLDTMDAFVGASGLVAFEYGSEDRCHNCTSYMMRYVLHYPDAGVVIVIDGSRGWDS